MKRAAVHPRRSGNRSCGMLARGDLKYCIGE
jgi:hypothetical protein